MVAAEPERPPSLFAALEDEVASPPQWEVDSDISDDVSSFGDDWDPADEGGVFPQVVCKFARLFLFG